MKFPPTENIIYKTKLTEEELVKRLSDYIEPVELVRLRIVNSNSTKLYEGHIDGNTFDIKRIISYRNSFLPRINGVIEGDYDGIIIRVKMRMHIFVIMFLCLWCGFVGISCIDYLPQMFSESNFDLATLIPFGMLIFAYALTMLGFKYESKKSKNDLQTLFEADIIKI